MIYEALVPSPSSTIKSANHDEKTSLPGLESAMFDIWSNGEPMTLPPDPWPYTLDRTPASIHVAQAIGTMQLFGVFAVYFIYQWILGIMSTIGLFGIVETVESQGTVVGWLEGILGGFLFRIVGFVILMILMAPFAAMIGGIGSGMRLARRLMIISQSAIAVAALVGTVMVRDMAFAVFAVFAFMLPSLAIVLALNTWSAEQWVRQGGMPPRRERYRSRGRRR